MTPRLATNDLARFLRAPEDLAGAGLSDWDRLLPVAREAGLLPRLTLGLERTIGLDAVPERVRPYLLSSTRLVECRHRDVRIEIGRLVDLLGPILDRVVLLKGAAYLAAGLPAAAGRVFGDIDILVPKSELASVEAMLGFGGWRLGDIEPYDEQYYRRWMHQLPPLGNAARGSVIDVHHTIVPVTARIDLAAAELLNAARPVPGSPALAVLSPPDMVLHSAVHLFNEGEFARGLRDLDDLNLLLRHFGAAAGFWDGLLDRAALLGLGRPLFFALRYTTALLGTPVPPDVLGAASRHAPAPIRPLMDALFGRALRSPHPTCRDALSGTALWLLYARAHYLRMPLHLLIPHLAHKAARRRLQPAAEA